MAGHTLKELGYKSTHPETCVCQGSAAAFDKLPGADPVLGPEMKSTGEVMG